MQTFGGYQAISELHRTGLGSVYAAKRIDAGNADDAASDGADADAPDDSPKSTAANGKPAAPFAIKTCAPAVDLIGQDAARALREAFLERAEIHRSIAAEPRTHWAPIYEIGTTPDGKSFLVSDQFPRSAARLIASRIKVNSDALFNILDSIFAGLIELEQSQGRSHGNLKPSNVLIGDGELRSARVALTDPASTGEVLARGGESADLRAVGELLHQLVTFRPSDPHDVPITRTVEWARLGRSNKAWRELCGQLLQPEGETYTIADARAQLRKMRGRGRLLVGSITGAIVAIALVGIVSGIVFYTRLQSQWQILTRAYDNWFGSLESSTLDSGLRARWSVEPAMKQLFADLPSETKQMEFDPHNIAGSRTQSTSLASPARAPFSFDALAKSRAAVDVIRNVERDLSPAQWTTLNDWRTRQSDDTVNGLHAPARYLGALLADVTIDPATDMVADGGNGQGLTSAIENLIALKTSDHALADLENIAGELRRQEQTLDTNSSEPFLRQFAEQATSVTDEVMKTAKSQRDRGLSALTSQLSVHAEQGRELTDFVAKEWNSPGLFDRARFDAEFKPPSLASDTAVRDWLAKAQEYRIDKATRDAQIAKVDHAHDDVVSSIQQLKQVKPNDSATRETFEKGLAALDPKIQALRDRQWTQLDSANHVGDDVIKQLATLNAEIDRTIGSAVGDPSKWLASSAQIKAPQPEIRAAYANKFKELVGGQTADSLHSDYGKFQALQQSVDRWQAVYADLSQKLPASAATASKTGDAALPPAFAAAANARLAALTDQALQSAIAVGSDGTPSVDASKVSQLTADYDAWNKSLLELATAARTATAVLDDGGGLDETTGSADAASPAAFEQQWKNATQLSKDPAVSAAVAPLIKRIDALRDSSSWTGDKAMAVLNDGQSTPELRIAALRRLLAADAPTLKTVEAFRRENGLRSSLDIMLQSTVKSITRREKIREELSATAPARWVAFVNSIPANANSDAMLDSAVSAADAFGVKDAHHPTNLSPRATYNVELHNLRAALGRPETQDKASALLDDFVNHLQALPKGDLEIPKVESMVVALKRYNTPDVNGPRPPWRLTSAPVSGVTNDPARAYTRGNDADRKLEFVLIDNDDFVPFYICTTELPVNLFLDEASGAMSAVRKTLPVFNDSTDRRVGPRVWEWDSRGSSIERAEVWLSNAQLQNAGLTNLHEIYAPEIGDPGFGGGLRGGNDPSPKHPLQQVAPKTAAAMAASLGCRLPNSDEWIATYNIYGRNQTDRNLRDRTWLTQLQYANSRPVSETLKQLLRPTAGAFGPAEATPQAATSDNDNTLWFKEVDAGGATTFASGGAANVAVHHLVGNVAEYVQDPTSEQFAVLGGSALSSPNVPFDQPQPIAANALDKGYSDVGLRLAFPAPTTDARRLKILMAKQAYMSPK